LKQRKLCWRFWLVRTADAYRELFSRISFKEAEANTKEARKSTDWNRAEANVIASVPQ
jgi:hypothetical protein